MPNRKVCTLFAVIVGLVACSSCFSSDPERKLLGKWQWEEIANKRVHRFQFEFFADGTAVHNNQMNGEWSQAATGTFKVIDPTHLKVDLTPSWLYGTTVYEMSWSDNDHINLRTGDNVIKLARLK